MKKTNDIILIVGIIIIILFLFQKKLVEKVTTKIGGFRFPNYKNCGVAPELLNPFRCPDCIKWCIDSDTGLEFERKLAPPDAIIFGLTDEGLIARSKSLNLGRGGKV